MPPPQSRCPSSSPSRSARAALDDGLREKLLDKDVRFRVQQEFNLDAVLTLVWLALLIGMGVWMWTFLRRSRDQMMGGGMLGNVTRSPARRYEAEEGAGKTFDDVAGLKSVKQDLKEIVEFLSEPEKFHKLGARVPKGVLLNGPPGTGKTLLAKAVAGEAGVPFFSINGSEFIQLFVGVGASRVRDMFKTAKKAAPAILFIDEIDAVGRHSRCGLRRRPRRTRADAQPNPQRDGRLHADRDGHRHRRDEPTRRARPGAATTGPFRPAHHRRPPDDRRPRATLGGSHPRGADRRHGRLRQASRATVGMTGADIMNLVNEAALWATRQGKSFVETDDFEYARDKILMGDAREDVLTEKEERVTAFHEAGHAILGWLIRAGHASTR